MTERPLHYDAESVKKLVAAYEALELHAQAGARAFHTDEHGWVWRMTVREEHAPGGYLHGGWTYTFLDVCGSFALEVANGPWFYSKTTQLSVTALRSPRVGNVVEFRATIDRPGARHREVAQTRMEAWVLLPEGELLVATASAIKVVMDRRVRQRANDIDPAEFEANAD